MSNYPDTNGNGVPDAFENRLPITEILNLPPEEYGPLVDTIIVELELAPRKPLKGELCYIVTPRDMGRRTIASVVEHTIVRRVIAAPKDFPFQPETATTTTATND